MKTLAAQDPEVYSAIVGEFRRQQDELELIASENYVSRAVLEAQGTVLTNKYAEGLPGKRYYGGCEYVDKVESLARDRVKALFGAPAANVQPHSGAQANAAVYLAAMKPGDTLLGLELSHGGHLTHGSPVNSSGKLYKGVSYGVDPVTGRIDMNRVREIAREHRPRMIVCGFSAYPRPLDFAAFRSIADEVGAVLLADIAHIAGIVVAGFHENPMPHCHFVTTTTHKTLRGPRGGVVMSDASWGVEMNKAVFPGTQGGPLEHVIAAKAVAFAEAQRPEFRDYIAAVLDNARAMSDRLQERGLKLVTDGTENHLMLIDLGEACSGKEAEDALGHAGMTANKNTVPGEKRSPFVTSGLRVGTAAMTTRGLRRAEATWVADRIADAIEARGDSDRLGQIRTDVHAMCARFPMYPESLVTGD